MVIGSLSRRWCSRVRPAAIARPTLSSSSHSSVVIVVANTFAPSTAERSVFARFLPGDGTGKVSKRLGRSESVGIMSAFVRAECVRTSVYLDWTSAARRGEGGGSVTRKGRRKGTTEQASGRIMQNGAGLPTAAPTCARSFDISKR